VDRLFLDANVLFSAAYWRDSGLLRLWRLPRCSLLTSSYAAEETRRNLAGSNQRARLGKLLESVTIVGEAESLGVANVGLPAKDQPILAAATRAKATHLLTGDARHFGPLYGRTIGGVLITRPAPYLQGLT
jgi:predicted nucleic acid-binding protein